MARYIDADKLIAERTIFMQDEEAFDVAVVLVSDIKLAPTADVEEVKHGEWILHDYAEVIEYCVIPNYECSVCGIWKREDSDYCPFCGAKMRGDDSGNE